jgi:hypothetical protein
MMKLTKNWLPILGFYLIVGGLAGMLLSTGTCTCKDANNGWIGVGLLIGVLAWVIHQKSSEPEPEPKRKRKHGR